MRRWRPIALRRGPGPTPARTRHFTALRVARDVHRRALLASAAAVSSAPLAGCPTPLWTDDPREIDGAEVTFRREHTGEFAPDEPIANDAAVLVRAVDAEPPRVTVRGRLLAGSRECYRVDLTEASLGEGRLLFRLTTEDDPEWDGNACSDIAQPHPYEVAVTFTEAAVPERVAVRHGDETVLEESV